MSELGSSKTKYLGSDPLILHQRYAVTPVASPVGRPRAPRASRTSATVGGRTLAIGVPFRQPEWGVPAPVLGLTQCRRVSSEFLVSVFLKTACGRGLRPNRNTLIISFCVTPQKMAPSRISLWEAGIARGFHGRARQRQHLGPCSAAPLGPVDQPSPSAPPPPRPPRRRPPRGR